MQVLVCKHTEMSYRTQTHAPEYAGWENEKGLAPDYRQTMAIRSRALKRITMHQYVRTWELVGSLLAMTSSTYIRSNPRGCTVTLTRIEERNSGRGSK